MTTVNLKLALLTLWLLWFTISSGFGFKKEKRPEECGYLDRSLATKYVTTVCAPHKRVMCRFAHERNIKKLLVCSICQRWNLNGEMKSIFLGVFLHGFHFLGTICRGFQQGLRWLCLSFLFPFIGLTKSNALKNRTGQNKILWNPVVEDLCNLMTKHF